jgi:hypothetical protein
MSVSHARRGLWRPSGRPGVPGLPRWRGGPGLGVQGAFIPHVPRIFLLNIPLGTSLIKMLGSI